ncbi:MAG: tRNA (adenosine(37)-N6)-threonylcarbamoyltransferase complex dimerization subunit type 1 TsaB [Acidobacteria bacterium]|nr:MAG: tRNA (adenosine(37)-N6)-threonylcarbamoyltransferase complex dimerization subunit type 1 TsaB [Acidobacteriota bacterium]
MFILALDTASNAGGVALSRNSEVIGLHMAKTPLKYSERLIDWVDFLLKQHDIKLGQIDCFAVAAGPGSFTGLRIGVAAAKGFGQAIGRPVVALSSLEALAFRFRHVSSLVAPVVDARRQQIYAAVYDTGAKEPRLRVPEDVARPDEWVRKLPDDAYSFVGDGAVLYRSTMLNAMPRSRVIDSDNCVLAELCQLAYLRHSQGKETGAQAVRANYLRPPDVQLQPVTDSRRAGSRKS